MIPLLFPITFQATIRIYASSQTHTCSSGSHKEHTIYWSVITFCSIKLLLTNNWINVSQKYWCSATSDCTYSQGQSSPKKEWALSIPTPCAFSALLAQAISESTSHTFTGKSCGYRWKWDTVLNSQEFAWSLSAKPPVSGPQASSRGCDSCEDSSVVLRGCKEHHTTHADICSLRGHSD